jgi:glycosyltransferase involved in cell wall biosynthesis
VFDLSYQVCWRGFVGGSTGYDRASREYLLALDRCGVDVKVEPMSYSQDIFVGGVNPEQVARIKELIAKPYATDKKKILVYHAQPNGVNPAIERNNYDKVIVLTVWETTRVPQSWIAPANQADAIIVPSSQNVTALRDSGIEVPIFIVPHGADFETYKPGNKKLEIPSIKDKFKFLSVFQWQHRKAPEVLLEAYLNEFTNKDNVALVIKTYWGHVVSKVESRGIVNQIAAFKNQYRDAPQILVTTSIFEDEDLKGLYTMADCFVLPTRGEGVGLPYIEALCSGVPVIATNWGGSTDFLKDNNSFPVDYDLMQTDAKLQTAISPNFNQLFTPDMMWAEPKVDSLRFRMRQAYENKEWCEGKGAAGRALMETMSWDSSGIAMKELLNKICLQ